MSHQNAQARAVAAMRAHGILNAEVVYEEAVRTHLPLDLACALLEQESGGGENVFGHDPTICAGWGVVTYAKFVAYRARRRASGNRLMQGVGPCQLTWWSTQDEADREGGCWQPRFNMRVGFRHLHYNVVRYGLRAGVKAYNGSGAAADAYARSVLARARVWKARFA
jgi:hypothetical protein